MECHISTNFVTINRGSGGYNYPVSCLQYHAFDQTKDYSGVNVWHLRHVYASQEIETSGRLFKGQQYKYLEYNRIWILQCREIPDKHEIIGTKKTNCTNTILGISQLIAPGTNKHGQYEAVIQDVANNCRFRSIIYKFACKFCHNMCVNDWLFGDTARLPRIHCKEWDI